MRTHLQNLEDVGPPCRAVGELRMVERRRQVLLDVLRYRRRVDLAQRL